MDGGALTTIIASLLVLVPAGFAISTVYDPASDPFALLITKEDEFAPIIAAPFNFH